MAIKTKVLQRKKQTFLEKLYLPYIAQGMLKTLSHFFKNLNNTQNIRFLEYPEQAPDDITPRYRGLHRLTKDENGEINCVACDLCATNCPSNCIFITASERPNGKTEKMPQSFEIDLLECIFCGFCVEACPKDAIRMDSGIFTKTGFDKESFYVNLTDLLAVPRGDFGQENGLDLAQDLNQDPSLDLTQDLNQNSTKKDAKNG